MRCVVYRVLRTIRLGTKQMEKTFQASLTEAIGRAERGHTIFQRTGRKFNA